MLSYCVYQPQQKPLRPVRRILTSRFCPLPTIKSVQTTYVPRIVYDAAHHLFREYSLHKPILIYQFQREKKRYDVYIERLEDGWKDEVKTFPIESDKKKTLFMIEGLHDAMKEEKEIQPLLPHMAQQLDIMCRMLGL